MPLERLDPARLLTPAEALRDYPAVTVDGDEVIAVGHGKVLPADERFAGAGPWPVVDADGRLLAVYVAHRDATVKPEVVVAPVEGPGPTSGDPGERE